MFLVISSPSVHAVGVTIITLTRHFVNVKLLFHTPLGVLLQGNPSIEKTTRLKECLQARGLILIHGSTAMGAIHG